MLILLLVLCVPSLCGAADILAVHFHVYAEADNGDCYVEVEESDYGTEVDTDVWEFSFTHTHSWQATVTFLGNGKADFTLSASGCEDTPPCGGFFWQSMNADHGDPDTFHDDWDTEPAWSDCQLSISIEYFE
jgi:hypothetical protein